jgi:hypothetical protein
MGYFDLKLKFFTPKLTKAVNTIVTGMSNSMRLIGKLTHWRTLNAKVTEWPMVKAVTRISSCFQSDQIYLAVKATMNRI